ncbi:MAG: alkaline phosphatase family protein [Gammaproteobacteria bacterium]|nr:alkaline phosphatase family protein [Gammaproteobacteria bacterium]
MIDPKQLQVPHNPAFAARRSATTGIEDQEPPILPIDHGAVPAMAVGRSAEQLLNTIDHFVFVMMENRSFDHMLGYLSHPDYGRRNDVDGLDGSTRQLGGDLTGTETTPLAGPFPSFYPNLDHDNDSIVRQINNGKMDAFVSEYGRRLDRTRGLNPRGIHNDPERALRFQTPDTMTTYDRLARDYTICDRWFCSVPAGTYPNRACYYTGVTPALNNVEMKDDFGYMSDLTLFDMLDHVGVDWKLFESDVSFLRVFDKFRIDQDRIRPISEMIHPLPAVTFIDPSFTGFPSDMPNNDDQPDTSVREGQKFIESIVEFVENSSQWESTMLVITYDEHGGFADHVPPPGSPGSSHPPEASNQISLSHPDASTFGVRVPTFVVSPLVARSGVSHKIFDHATVFRTLLQRFAPQHLNSKIIPERVRRARHLGDVLVDQTPLAVNTARNARPLMGAKPAARAKVTFAEELDQEDLEFVLKEIGRPSRHR